MRKKWKERDSLLFKGQRVAKTEEKAGIPKSDSCVTGIPCSALAGILIQAIHVMLNGEILDAWNPVRTSRIWYFSMRREQTDQEMASVGRECLPTLQYAELTVPNLPCAGKTTALHRSPQIDNPPDSGQTIFLLFVSPGAGLTYK
ncbi:MAG: hypothetical protein K9N21_16250 [Deltaproteobacteria bacterium]|nr:hypothetical protein [Deltaproteobacteria bacterium]